MGSLLSDLFKVLNSDFTQISTFSALFEPDDSQSQMTFILKAETDLRQMLVPPLA